MFNGNAAYPVRRVETVVEATYQYHAAPWWQLQGVVQYTMKPGAGATANSDPNERARIPSSWVVGLHTGINF